MPTSWGDPKISFITAGKKLLPGIIQVDKRVSNA